MEAAFNAAPLWTHRTVKLFIFIIHTEFALKKNEVTQNNI